MTVHASCPVRSSVGRPLTPRTSARVLAGLTIALLVAELPSQGWVQRSTLTAPAARNSFAMAQDVSRNVAVLFGGHNGTPAAFGDTWEWNGFGWAQRFTPVAPPARWGHGVVYDTRRSRVVLFGGFSPTAPTGWLADTWEWDGASWSQRSVPAQPPARGYFGMAYDSWRGQTLVFGGVTATNQHLDDIWAFDGAAWSQIVTTTRPSVRRGVAMAFDDARGQTVLFGGGDGAQTFGDTWTFDGSDWQQRTTVVAPAARQEARLGHDGLCGRTVLHGGADNAFANNFGDSWEWDGSGWTAIAGASPSGRHGAGVAFDAQRGQMALWGGRDANGFFSDSWQLASPCSRTMSVVTAPQLMLPAVFRYSYPPSAAGHFGIHLLTLHQAGGFAVPIPGFSSFGECFVDLFSIQMQTFVLFDSSGVSDLMVQMPSDPYLIGLPFDVQAVDMSFQSSTVYWADNDAEVAIAPPPPPLVASFAATPTFGLAPLVVQFADTSTGSPTSWQWDFENDGVVDSILQNPTWTYASAGLYSVRLVAANFLGSTAQTRTSYIFAGPIVPNPLLNMVAIQGGTFQMGSPVTPLNVAPYFNQAQAQPVHAVTITLPFWMGKYEVTQAEYQAVMGTNPSAFVGPQKPVETVSWTSAMAYCSALTVSETAAGRVPAGYQYRLPTEAEWEYCYRAGTTTEYWFGPTIACGQAHFAFNYDTGSSCSIGQTANVGSYPANPWGLHDVAGNVWEWCLDSWDFTANYPASAVSDPYVSSGPDRVVRGGSWSSDYDSYDCRAALRSLDFPGDTRNFIGFRVVLAPVLVP